MSNYWIGDSVGRVLGPLTLQSLRELVSSGRLKAVTRASRDGERQHAVDPECGKRERDCAVQRQQDRIAFGEKRRIRRGGREQ